MISLSSTKTLILATALLLFFLVGVLSFCEFAMVQGFTFYYPLGKKKCTLLPEGTDVSIQAAQSQNLFKPSVTILLQQCHC